MGKYSKKLLNRVQEHNMKKLLDETDDFSKIQEEAERLGLGEFVHRHKTKGATSHE